MLGLQLVELFGKAGGGVSADPVSLAPARRSDVNSQLLFQHQACLPAAMFPTMRVMDSL